MTPHERACITAQCKMPAGYSNSDFAKAYVKALLDSPEITNLAKTVDMANTQGTVNAAQLIIAAIEKEAGIL